jgi:histidinol dehydrogenase
MRIVRGLEQSREALLTNRGLGLDSAPASVLERTESAFGKAMTPIQTAEYIVTRVREGGDEAVRDITRRLDGIEVAELEVSKSTIQDAYDSVAAEVVEALQLSAERIRRFQQKSLPESWVDFDEGYGELVNAVGRAGIYVPGGTARFPSTVLMSAIPAKVAGVREVVITTNPGIDQGVHPVVLVAADIAGVDRVFQIGGAQAIAALAYGTETVPKVDMVCGPGGLFTTLAKKLVYGEVGLDGLYGPTETLVLADDSGNPTLCAADLLAQAEHDILAKPVLITTSERLAERVNSEISVRLGTLDRMEIAARSVKEQGIIAVVADLEEGFELANAFAPEHVSLMLRDPWSHVGRVKNAGAVFLGDFSHEVLGDYVAGPSHVMPTGGTARFGSGLNVRSFLKFSPIVGLSDKRASQLSKAASLLGRVEGLTAHAEAAEIRDEMGGEET